MIQVIEKALKIRPLTNTDWAFTIDAAKLYLSAKGYLLAGDYGRAANVFARLMDIAPLFSTDTKTLACDAFAKAGDAANASRFCR
jgi:two-component SAPR family response regulator